MKSPNPGACYEKCSNTLLQEKENGKGEQLPYIENDKFKAGAFITWCFTGSLVQESLDFPQ